MSRAAELTWEAMDEAQRRVTTAITAGRRGADGAQGPLRVWLHNPGLADRAQALGAYCRYETSLGPRLSELAIIVTAAHWRSGFEWHVHAPIALAAGVDPGVVEAIRTGASPAFAREDEAALHGFATELLDHRQVSNAAYARALKALGETGVIDLVGILGYYGLISMTINAFEIPVPPPEIDPFAALPG